MIGWFLVLLEIGITLGLCAVATGIGLSLQAKFHFGDGWLVLIMFVSMFAMVGSLNVLAHWLIKRKKNKKEPVDKTPDTYEELVNEK